MKARIEKKLSKRLVEVAHSLFPRAWVFPDISELAEEQRTSVSHVLHVGGGVDYWGDGMDAFTCWESWSINWMWSGSFESYPEGHEREFYPDTTGFNPTTQNLLRLAAECEARSQGTQP